jgi:catechol 2,3-dioxygenase-like lactoylglutathione lyase family enzyme
MAFLGIEHVQLDIADGGENRARDFYQTVLGMIEISKPPSLSQSGVWFRAGEVELHLDGDLRGAPSATAHPGIRVTDLDALAERCSSAGSTPRFDSRFPGRRRFYVNDPFGNRLEFFELNDRQR